MARAAKKATKRSRSGFRLKSVPVIGAGFVLAVALVASVGMLLQTNAATPSPTVKEAQTIMKKFAIPAGPVDGLMGAQTRRGLCTFRYMSGLPINRNTLDTTTLAKLRDFNTRYASLGAIPAPTFTGYTASAVVEKTCQSMLYAEYNTAKARSYYKKIMPVSTGMVTLSCKNSNGTARTCDTPNIVTKLGGTTKGWLCSWGYNESCIDNADTDGMFGYIANHSGYPAGYGNMYNFRNFKDWVYGVHGSKNVPTYPASRGCVRVTLADSDWMYRYVGNNNTPPYFQVRGKYIP